MCRTVRDKRTYIFVIVFLLSYSISHAESSSSKSVNTFFVGLEYTKPHFSIDHYTHVGGKVVHFFTSRPIDYLAWYFKYSHQEPLSDNFGYGGISGMGFLLTGYWLNREMLDYFVSLDPLKSKFFCWYIDGGVLLYWRLGPLKILPFLAVPIGISQFRVTMEEEEELGNAFYFGLYGGVEAQLGLSKSVFLTFGYKTTVLLNSTPQYKINRMPKLEGRFNKMPLEIYAGLSFKVE